MLINGVFLEQQHYKSVLFIESFPHSEPIHSARAQLEHQLHGPGHQQPRLGDEDPDHGDHHESPQRNRRRGKRISHSEKELKH